MHIPEDTKHRYVGRGDIRMVRVQPPMPGGLGRPRVCPEGRAWFWLHDRLLELVAVRTSPWSRASWHAAGIVHRLSNWVPRSLPAEEQAVWTGALAQAGYAGLSSLLAWAAMAKANADRAVACFANSKKTAMAKWAKQATAGGASAGHRFTKGATCWLPDPLDDRAAPPDVEPAGLLERADLLLEFWQDIWAHGTSQVPQGFWAQYPRAQLPVPTVAQVRAAAKTFPRATGRGAERMHPRHFSLLLDAALSSWNALMIQSEELGLVPKQLALLVLVFLPKPDGSHRPIGLFLAGLRVWGG